jgi:hypothetical protein
VYDACPYCLTEIIVEETPAFAEEDREFPMKQDNDERLSMDTAREKTEQEPPKTRNCPHQFGYLSKRASKEGIPEECMMCENIVQCMLKNVTG